MICISIHALLAESDPVFPVLGRLSPISIHALLAESDMRDRGLAQKDIAFQSTLSLRRATHIPCAERICTNDFNPRSPCGERRGAGRGSPWT